MMCPHKNKKGAEILLGYMTSQLDPDVLAEFEKHTADCAECRDSATSQKAVWQALDEWTPPEVSADFDSRLYARIDRDNAASPWSRWWRAILDPGARFVYWKPALAGVVACAVVAIALVVRVPSAPDPSQQIRAEAIDVEQVEHTLEDLDMLTPSQGAGNPL